MLALPELLLFCGHLPHFHLSPPAFGRSFEFMEISLGLLKTNYMWKAFFGEILPFGNSSPCEKHVHAILPSLSGRVPLFSVVSLKLYYVVLRFLFYSYIFKGRTFG